MVPRNIYFYLKAYKRSSMVGEFHPLMIFSGVAFLAQVYQGDLMVQVMHRDDYQKVSTLCVVQGKLLN